MLYIGLPFIYSLKLSTNTVGYILRNKWSSLIKCVSIVGLEEKSKHSTSGLSDLKYWLFFIWTKKFLTETEYTVSAGKSRPFVLVFWKISHKVIVLLVLFEWYKGHGISSIISHYLNTYWLDQTEPFDYSNYAGLAGRADLSWGCPAGEMSGVAGGTPDEMTGSPGRRDESLGLALTSRHPAHSAGRVRDDSLHCQAARSRGGCGGRRGWSWRWGRGGDCPVYEDSRHSCQDVALSVTSPAISSTVSPGAGAVAGVWAGEGAGAAGVGVGARD